MVRDLVVSGQLAVGVTDTDDALGAVRRGAPVAVIVPDQDDDGTLVIPGTVALVAGGPDPAQGRLLVDFLASRDVERILIESGFCQIPLRLTGMQPEWLGGSGLKSLDVSFEDVRQQLPRAQEELRTVFVR